MLERANFLPVAGSLARLIEFSFPGLEPQRGGWIIPRSERDRATVSSPAIGERRPPAAPPPESEKEKRRALDELPHPRAVRLRNLVQAENKTPLLGSSTNRPPLFTRGAPLPGRPCGLVPPFIFESPTIPAFCAWAGFLYRASLPRRGYVFPLLISDVAGLSFVSARGQRFELLAAGFVPSKSLDSVLHEPSLGGERRVPFPWLSCMNIQSAPGLPRTFVFPNSIGALPRASPDCPRTDLELCLPFPQCCTAVFLSFTLHTVLPKPSPDKRALLLGCTAVSLVHSFSVCASYPISKKLSPWFVYSLLVPQWIDLSLYLFRLESAPLTRILWSSQGCGLVFLRTSAPVPGGDLIPFPIF